VCGCGQVSGAIKDAGACDNEGETSRAKRGCAAAGLGGVALPFDASGVEAGVVHRLSTPFATTYPQYIAVAKLDQYHILMAQAAAVKGSGQEQPDVAPQLWHL
jgi:hypothetical protein